MDSGREGKGRKRRVKRRAQPEPPQRPDPSAPRYALDVRGPSVTDRGGCGRHAPPHKAPRARRGPVGASKGLGATALPRRAEATTDGESRT